jgi:hypothetical protein
VCGDGWGRGSISSLDICILVPYRKVLDTREALMPVMTVKLLLQLAVMDRDAKFAKEQWQKTIEFPWTTYKDPDIRRRFQKLSILGYAALERDKFIMVLQNTHITYNICIITASSCHACCDTVGTSAV